VLAAAGRGCRVGHRLIHATRSTDAGAAGSVATRSTDAGAAGSVAPDQVSHLDALIGGLIVFNMIH
jgi:hypothetical protein